MELLLIILINLNNIIKSIYIRFKIIIKKKMASSSKLEMNCNKLFKILNEDYTRTIARKYCII